MKFIPSQFLYFRHILDLSGLKNKCLVIYLLFINSADICRGPAKYQLLNLALGIHCLLSACSFLPSWDLCLWEIYFELVIRNTVVSVLKHKVLWKPIKRDT